MKHILLKNLIKEIHKSVCQKCKGKGYFDATLKDLGGRNRDGMGTYHSAISCDFPGCHGGEVDREENRRITLGEPPLKEAPFKPDESFFDTLSEALTAVEVYLEKNRALVDPAEYPSDEADRLGIRGPFQFGGIPYEQKREHLYKLVQFKGKPTKNRGLLVSIYRMPSGRYELTRYIS